ncbi:hypothetical protein SIID45300_02002 [Candidatus Magnetaquicoccaceae bacterium FCR-1]|uniref:Uncharacterized protein n=1 Tax=Candidatus Magnetaquiglobus chichijimensis TaxID=3141448 RepID=A0ABQ0C9X2_9PROT
MSQVGLIGSPDAFKANLLNLRQNLQEIVAPLHEIAPGLPWQRTNQADEYHAPQPDFENVLREVLAPDGVENAPETEVPFKPVAPRESDRPPVEGPREQPRESLPPQLSRNMLDFEERLGWQSASLTFTNVRSASGHYRTELARNAYASVNAMGRAD